MVLYRVASPRSLYRFNREHKCGALCGSRGRYSRYKYECVSTLVEECFGRVEWEFRNRQLRDLETIVVKHTRSYFSLLMRSMDTDTLIRYLDYPDQPAIEIEIEYSDDERLHGVLKVEGSRESVKLDKNVLSNRYQLTGSVSLRSNGVVVIRSRVGKIVLVPLPSPRGRRIFLGDKAFYPYLVVARRREAPEIGVAPHSGECLRIEPYTPLGLALLTSYTMDSSSIIELRTYAPPYLRGLYDPIHLYLAAVINERLRGENADNAVLTWRHPSVRPHRKAVAVDLWDRLINEYEYKVSFMVLRGLEFMLMVFGVKLYPVPRKQGPLSIPDRIVEGIKKVNRGEMSVREFADKILINSDISISYIRFRRVIGNISEYEKLLPVTTLSTGSIMAEESEKLRFAEGIAKSVSRSCVGFAPSTLRLDYFSNMDEETLKNGPLHHVLEVLATTIGRPLTGVAVAELSRAADTATAH